MSRHSFVALLSDVREIYLETLLFELDCNSFHSCNVKVASENPISVYTICTIVSLHDSEVKKVSRARDSVI